jgi:two-component system NtrC family sensor kinase
MDARPSRTHLLDPPRAVASAPTGTLRAAPLVAGMIAAILAVAGLAWWDDQREATAALRDLETQQTVVAFSLAAGLRAHLAAAARESAGAGESPPELAKRVAQLLADDPGIERAGELTVFVAPPGGAELVATDGRQVDSPPLRAALDGDARALRLERPQAAQVGLPARTAMAGLAHVDAGSLGRWGIAAVASAARERDREKRALGRLLLSVFVTSALVLAFGGAALRRQRKELELQRGLAVAEVRRQADETLSHAQRAATMGTFAMGIAHEVATPLSVIVGRSEQLLGRVRDDERAAHGAEVILAQADRIQQIIRRFLDMARGGPPALARTDPAEIARSAAASVEHRFAKAGVELSADVPSRMPAIQCDRALLEQALVNLLLNACEACGGAGHLGHHVEVSARSDAESVVFVVTDDGAGITREHAARAARPFFTTKADGGGTGLGLAIATEIAKIHRGELTIGPDPTRGTRACIAIPLARLAPQASGERDAERDRHGPTVTS